MPATWIPNPEGQRELFQGPEAVDFLNGAAEQAVVEAVEAGPTWGFYNYPESLDWRPAEIRADGMPEAQYGTNNGAWHLVEYGSARNKIYRALGKAAEAIGTFKETPK